MNVNDLKDNILEFKDTLLKSKKYWIIYLVFITLTCLSTVSKDNFTNPQFELLTFAFVSILGIFCIVYYFMHDSYKELHKIAFVIILCFGISCSLIVPICDVSDETEHLVRAEITSQGVIAPHWTGEDKGLTRLIYFENNSPIMYLDVGYATIQSAQFFYENRGKTIFETNNDDSKKINKTSIIYWSGAFEQNLFYGYLPQALGVFIAKLLNLNVIWMLWLARICNILCYAFLVSLAIQKIPYLKIPLLTVACIPITIYQAASASVDSMIFGLGILTVSYFIYMCKTKNLEKKNILIFTMICLLLGLCKLPYLSFIFLMILVPKENFKENKLTIYIILSIILVSIIGALWSKHSAPLFLHSWRSIQSFNSTQQINFLINNPEGILTFIHQIFNSELQFSINGLFNFFNGTPGSHYADKYYFITIILQLFLVFVLFAYPKNVRFKLKTKIGSIGIILLTYVGTCLVMLIAWADVGKTNLDTSIRYFIPLLALIPISTPLKLDFDTNKFDKYTIVLIIGFLATLILSFAIKYY